MDAIRWLQFPCIPSPSPRTDLVLREIDLGGHGLLPVASGDRQSGGEDLGLGQQDLRQRGEVRIYASVEQLQSLIVHEAQQKRRLARSRVTTGK